MNYIGHWVVTEEAQETLRQQAADVEKTFGMKSVPVANPSWTCGSADLKKFKINQKNKDELKGRDLYIMKSKLTWGDNEASHQNGETSLVDQRK